MLRRLRETAPVGLVPVAWGFAASAHLDLLSREAVLVAHGVMTTVLVLFSVLSYHEMRSDPVLRVWLVVVVAGVPVTLLGAYGVATAYEPASQLAVGGWMLLPAAALVPTARASGLSARVYGTAAMLSGAGTVLFAVSALSATGSTIGALALAGLGQTLAIAAAVRES